MKITGKLIVITGGASGLGAATANHFLSLGANVATIDLNLSNDAALHDNLHQYSADVSDEAQIEQIFENIKAKHGAIHFLVNAAGCAAQPRRTFGSGGRYSLEVFRKVIDVNLTGSFNCARYAAQLMVDNQVENRGERGVIIHVASINAFDGPMGTVAYTAAKAGVHGMTITMARDLAKYGIRVNTIAPGSFATKMLNETLPEITEQLLSITPFPNDTLGDPDDFASLAQHICENQMLNGETIRLDAALRLSNC